MTSPFLDDLLVIHNDVVVIDDDNILAGRDPLNALNLNEAGLVKIKQRLSRTDKLHHPPGDGMIVDPLDTLDITKDRIINPVLLPHTDGEHNLHPIPIIKRRSAINTGTRHNILAAVNLTILKHVISPSGLLLQFSFRVLRL